MKRGRPAHSEVRQNIIEILYFLKKGYGYDIYKIYRALFPKVTMRLVYYHLKKGVALGELKIDRIEKTKGDYSWGGEAEKIYYSLGPAAKPTFVQRIKDYLDLPKETK